MFDLFEGVIEALKASFGRPITFKGDGSDNVDFIGVYDGATVVVDPATGERVATPEISILLAIADIPRAPKNRDEFVVGDVSYLVRHCEPDGRGAMRVFLMEKD